VIIKTTNLSTIHFISKDHLSIGGKMFRTILFVSLTILLLAACTSQTPTSTASPGYPEPQELEPAQETEPELVGEVTAYPAPQSNTGPETSPDSSYPAPESIEVFKIIPEESEVSYEVGEVFLNQNNRFNVAIGVTSQVSGDVFVDRVNPQKSSIGPISVDISQFTSDSGRRDNAIRGRFLESSIFPISTFTPIEIQGLPDSYQEGEPVTIQIRGDLTIRDTTKPVTFEVTLSGEGSTMIGKAETTILMSDFGFGPISIGGILNTEDEVKIKFVFVARP
jgi:polyisoprenoid-binding protein YceI